MYGLWQPLKFTSWDIVVWEKGYAIQVVVEFIEQVGFTSGKYTVT